MSAEIDDIVIAVKDFIYAKYKAERKMPSVAVVSEEFKVSNYKVIEIFRILEHQGFLKRNFSRYGVGAEGGTAPVPSPAPVPVMVEAKRLGPEPSMDQKKAEADQKAELESGHSMNAISPMLLTIIRIVLTLISIGAIGYSVYYTSIWLRGYLPTLGAVGLSGIMVTFSCIAFETVIILKRNRQYLMMSMFALLFVIVLVFSMSSTVAGQYNQRIKSSNVEVVANSDVTQARLSYDILAKQEAQITKQIADKSASRAVYQRLFDSYDAEKQKADPKGFTDTSKKLDSIDKELQGLNDKLTAKQEEERKYLQTAKGPGAVQQTTAEVPSFYNWIHSTVGLSAAMTEFWMSIFPAIFIDLIAPFSLAIALFVRSVGTPAKAKRKKGWMRLLFFGAEK